MNDRIDLKAPKRWKDLTLDQLRAVAETMRLTLTREEVLFVLFCRFCKVKKVIATVRHIDKKEGFDLFEDENGKRFTLDTWQIADFCKRLEFVLDETPCDIANPTTIDRHLMKATFGQYFRANDLLKECSSRQDDYLPGQMKQALEILGDSGTDCNDMATYGMVLLWWHGVTEVFRLRYPNVFQQDDGESKKVSSFDTLQNIYLMLNDDDPTKNAELNDCNVHDVFSALDNKIRKMKIEAEQLKKLK